MNQNQEFLTFAKDIAVKAGNILRKYFNEGEIGESYKGGKGSKTIVTLADMEINELLISRVREKYPEHGVYGEEESFGEDRSVLWVCDPVDGTAMFRCGLPISVFSLALVVDGEPTLGVVYDPWLDEMYEAVKGEGAYRNGAKISVNPTRLGDDSAVSCFDSSPRYVNAEMNGALRPAIELLDEKTYLVSIGVIIRACMAVATGGFVAEVTSVSKGKNMDIAAVKVIVEEAGGRVTDIYGEEQRYDRDIRGAIVSNGVVHDEIVGVVKNGREERK